MYHEKRFNLRLPEDVFKEMQRLTKQSNKSSFEIPEYDSESHFARCAIIKLIREKRAEEKEVENESNNNSNSRSRAGGKSNKARHQ